MHIYIDIAQCQDHTGRVFAAEARAEVSHSPREGYDNSVLAELEQELGTIITAKINCALATNHGRKTRREK